MFSDGFTAAMDATNSAARCDAMHQVRLLAGARARFLQVLQAPAV
jgi:hypothetical protein